MDGGSHWSWIVLPLYIYETLADIVDDSIAYTADSTRMSRHILHELGYDSEEIALPIGDLVAMDFSDRYHGVVVMKDSLISHAY